MQTTDEQKQSISRSALRAAGKPRPKGLPAVLVSEDADDYRANTRAFVAKFAPVDGVELRLVERMADCEWRMMRARYVEAAALDLQLDDTAELVEERFDHIDEATRLAYAMSLADSHKSATVSAFQRQESRLHRQYERAYKLLLEMRRDARKQAAGEKIENKIFENEPKPLAA